METWWKVTKLVLTEGTTTASLSRVEFYLTAVAFGNETDDDTDPVEATADDEGAIPFELGEHIDLQGDNDDVLGIGDIVKLTVERLARL